MGFVRVQHVFNHKSGLAEDGIVNTFHFTGPGDITTVNAPLLVSCIEEFYDNPGANQEVAINGYLSNAVMAPIRHTFKVYDMEQPTPRVPIWTESSAGSTPNTNEPMPSEVAFCLSYRATPVSGQSQARSRGRIYLGPLSTLTDSFDSGTGASRPALGLLNDALDAGKNLAAAALAVGFTWCVYSPRSQEIVPPGGGGEFGTYPIAELLADNAWDTQRRRGVRATSRLTLAV